jgi:hypothetical protein
LPVLSELVRDRQDRNRLLAARSRNDFQVWYERVR